MSYSRLRDVYDPSTDGDVPPYTWGQRLRENQEWRHWKRPGVLLRTTVADSLASATLTGVGWDDVVYSTHTFGWTTSGFSFVFPLTGTYLINCFASFGASTGGNERVLLMYTGTSGGSYSEHFRWAKRPPSASGVVSMSFTHLYRYDGGSTNSMRIYAYQDSGAALNLLAGAHLSIKLVAQG